MRATYRYVVIVSLSLLVGSAQGVAAQGTIEEFTARITDELRSQNPAAAEIFARANVARDSGDLLAAEKHYREVMAMVPDYDHAVRRLCSVLAAQGKRSEAIGLCRRAVTMDSSLVNRGALVQALALAGDVDPTFLELQEAMTHSRAVLDSHAAGEYELSTVCVAAGRAGDLFLLRRCFAQLEPVAESRDLVNYLAWTIEMMAGNHLAAEAVLTRALAEGMAPDQHAALLQATRDATRDAPSMPAGATRIAGIVGGAWLAGLLLLLGVGSVLSHLALRTAGRLPTVHSGESVGLDAVLRKSYRTVLWLSCGYYYISIPLVLLVVVGLGAGIVYAALAAGRLPIRLLLFVAAIVLVTLWAALKSVFVRARDEDPGELLDTADHPRLHSVLGEVADEIETRPVDNVYLTPGTELAVMERGGMLRQLRGASERCLILGVGVLDGMKLGPFKAILAHEYGHFSNRDTAGGGFALAVRRSLLTMARALGEGGAAAWYNPAWIFLNGFYRVFLRISQGASRLQEVLADRWAAFAYGAAQFERGLRHVIRRSIQFDVHANATLQEVTDKGYAMANFYSYRPAETLSECQLEEAVGQAVTAEPSPYDSHPSPDQRFEWVHSVPSEPTGDLSDADEDAWDLLTNRGELELWMTDVIRRNVEAAYNVAIPG